MTRAIFHTASTLNGFLADDADSLAWLLSIPQDAETAETAEITEITAFTDKVGALVEGSSTYEWLLREEGLLDRPERWQQFYGDRPTFVFTSRVLPRVPGADIRFVRGPVREHWDEIAAAAGTRDVWIVGGGDLAGQFADEGLLNEIVVTFAPATLRSGRPLLPRDLDHSRLELTGVRQAGPFAELSYRLSPPADGE